ncbi:hypothetical protein HGT70_15860 [Rosenbergiella collisarenosi]|uniref:DNA topoisomerase family protein n=1 Tax=Rosenbergiella collisarenosi TaxID=1544695 RepID=UPI001BDA6443|nr:topoisomerase DNA-binding C4 zinc finger domain-containing protein [Rosenbergiella collisarenosi]MBT0722735.1 hypothetical protein [Rosenbergiella collisarenosi]
MSRAELFSISQQELCPQCGAELVIRSGQHGPFLGCSAYPQCNYLRSLNPSSDGHIIKVLEGHECPKCGADKALRKGRYGMFIGCTDYPQCDYSEAIAQTDSTDITCPECRSGILAKKQSRFGKTFYACSNYPKCRYALNYPPIEGTCPQCGFNLLYHKKSVKGLKTFCANKSCGVEVSFSPEE